MTVAMDVSDELYEVLTGEKPADVRRRLDAGGCPWVDGLVCDDLCRDYSGCRRDR